MTTGWAPVPQLVRPRINRDWLVEVVDLRDIIRVEERRDHGEYLSGRCPHPAHEDKNPSFIVSPARYTCLASGAHGGDGFSGTVIDWYCHDQSPPTGLTFGELLSKVATFYNVGAVPANFIKKPRPMVDWVEELPDTRVDVTKLDALEGPELEWFAWRYQLSCETIAFERIGYHEKLRSFVIPIWDADHKQVIAVRYRRFDDAFKDGSFRMGGWDVPRYFGMKGVNPVLLYNRWRLMYPRSDTLRIAFGELTSLFVDRSLGLDALTCTNGAKSFRPYFANLIRRVYSKVIILPDGGELLEAVRVGAMFGPMACIVKPLYDSGDLIDWCRAGWVRLEDYQSFEVAHLAPYDGIVKTYPVELWQT